MNSNFSPTYYNFFANHLILRIPCQQRIKWWDDVIKSDIASYYQSAEEAEKDNVLGKTPLSGRKGTYIWGDRVRIIKSMQGVKRVSARGKEYWINNRHLGGEPTFGNLYHRCRSGRWHSNCNSGRT